MQTTKEALYKFLDFSSAPSSLSPTAFEFYMNMGPALLVYSPERNDEKRESFFFFVVIAITKKKKKSRLQTLIFRYLFLKIRRPRLNIYNEGRQFVMFSL